MIKEIIKKVKKCIDILNIFDKINIDINKIHKNG